MTLCVIPARGGSKRIPRKNIRPFLGKPMIAWPITTALESGLFEHVIVSTDDDEIADIAKAWGAEVPFIRPAELADDYTGTDDVVIHAILRMQELGWRGDVVCCLYATALFTSAEHLRQGLEMLRHSGKDYVFTACPFPYPIQRALRRTPHGVEMFQPEHAESRSQDLEPAWHDAGQFYWGRTQAWLNRVPIFSHAADILPLRPIEVQDIDSDEDWQRAEFLMRYLQKGGQQT